MNDSTSPEAAKRPPLFLISNDDGINAPGIQTLMKRLSKVGEVWVAAPHIERSASSQMISIWNPLRVNELSPRVFAIEGTPSDCMMLGLQKLVPRTPDWVVTGINRGGNIGTDTLYSGTVAAATEGCIVDIPAIAASLCGLRPKNYDTAAEVVVELLGKLNPEKIKGSVVNVNVPDVPLNALRGYRRTSLANRSAYPDIVQNVDPRGREYYWHGAAEHAFQGDKDCDHTAVEEGYVSVTVLAKTRYDAKLTEELDLD